MEIYTEFTWSLGGVIDNVVEKILSTPRVTRGLRMTSVCFY